MSSEDFDHSTSDRKGRWNIAALLAIGVLVNYVDRVNISVAHDALHREFGISVVTFGYVVSAFNWTYAAAQLPMGVWLDRFGVKKVGRLAALLWSLASFGAAFSPNIPAFFSMRLLLGIGEAPTFPANAKAIGQWFPRRQLGLATATFDSAAKLGPAIAVPLVGMILIHFGWRWSFAISGILSFLYFLLFCRTYRDPIELHHKTSMPQSPATPLLHLLKQRKVIGLVTGFFGYNYCFNLLLFWLPTYFTSLKLNATQSFLFTSIPWLFASATDLLIGGLCVDRLIKRGYSQTKVRLSVLIGGTVVGLAIAGAMFTSNSVIALIWISISLGGVCAAAPVGWSIPTLISPPDSVGKVGGILNTGNQIAGIIAPIVTGYVVGLTHSFLWAFAVAAALLILGIAAYVFLLGRLEPFPTHQKTSLSAI